MPEKETPETELTLQMFRPLSNFRQKLERDFQDEVVIVEFCCCGFLKKALGCLTEIGPDYLSLTGVKGDIVPVDIFGQNGLIDTEEQGFEVVIRLENVCAVELLSCPPPCPPKRGRPYEKETAEETEEE